MNFVIYKCTNPVKGVKYDTAEQNSRQRKLVKKRFLEIPEDLEVSIEELVKIVKENSRWYRLKQ